MDFTVIQERARGLFRQEAAELLEELEAAILEMEQTNGLQDSLDRVFRVMHTLKGSGATAGLCDLARFLHQVEEIFDFARQGRTPVDRELIDMALRVGDTVRAYLQHSSEEAVAILQEADTWIAPFLAQRLANVGQPEASKPQPGTVLGSSRSIRRYLIRFRPKSQFFLTGADPGMFLEDLRSLGEAQITCLADRLPPLPQIDPEQCYYYWEIDLQSPCDEAAIREVFLFIEEDCELEIIPRQGEANDQPCPPPDVPQTSATTAPQIREPAAIGSNGKSLAKEVRPNAEMLRVSADKLDRLVNMVGELVILRAQLGNACQHLAQPPPELLNATETLSNLTMEMRDLVLNIRMTPIGQTLAKFKRLVRDLSHELGKEADLEIIGAETELDKSILERLTDPLTHLIRNSLDHGLEKPEVREKSGKPRRGTIRLCAEQRGDRVIITVADDGRGLDAERIRAKAVERGIIPPEAGLSEAECIQLIFQPGFSTAQNVTQVSGRGVGLDVVKRQIESLRGKVEVWQQPGQGAQFRLSLPLTLAIIEGLMVDIAGDRYILPLVLARETIELQRTAHSESQRNITGLRGEVIPYLCLRTLFGYPRNSAAVERVVIVEVEEKRLGLVVDEVVGNHQTVLRSLGWLSNKVPVFAGATILGDGQVALIIDVPALIQWNRRQNNASLGLEY